MATLTVGAGAQYEYNSIAAAVTAAHSGDTVDVQAGTYTNDFVDTSKSLTLQAVGGVVKMVATTSPPDQKAIITEGSANGSFTINGFDISGSAVAAGAGGNGAGIRYQGGNLTLNNDYIHNNQDGLLANADPTGTISINNSEFAYNGSGTGQTHNLYVGDISRVTVNNSYFHDANVGHEIKSRAENTVITNTRVYDNNSTASYSIDLPNGGNATITNDTIEQGANSQNPIIISYGEEGNLHAGTAVQIANDTIVNDKGGSVYGVVNRAATPVTISADKLYGLTPQNVAYGPATVAGDTYLQSRPTLDTTSHWQPSDPASAPISVSSLGDPTTPSLLGSGTGQTLPASGLTAAQTGTDVLGTAAGAGGTSAGSASHAGLPATQQSLSDMTALPGVRSAGNPFLPDGAKAAGAHANWIDSAHNHGALAMMGHAPGAAA